MGGGTLSVTKRSPLMTSTVTPYGLGRALRTIAFHGISGSRLTGKEGVEKATPPGPARSSSQAASGVERESSSALRS